MILPTRILVAVTAIAVIVAVLGAWLWRMHRRQRRTEDQHAARRRRLDHLDELIAAGDSDGRLTEDVAGRLRELVSELRAESLQDA